MRRSNENLPASGNSTGRACHRPVLAATALVALAIFAPVEITGMITTAEAAPFNPPSLEGYTQQDEHDADGDGDGIKETHVQKYTNAAGDSIFSMTTKGRLWAWSLQTKGEAAGGPNNYVILDSNCDGVFDEVYGLDDEFHVPDCVK